MRSLIRLLLTLLIAFCFAQPTQAEETSLDRFAALAASEHFLLLLDQGKYNQCWDEASALFREASVKQQWEGRVAHLRAQYGDFKNRIKRFHKYLEDAEGAPEGEYYFMIYGSSYTGKESVIETVTVMKEDDGRWRVSGYTIK